MAPPGNYLVVYEDNAATYKLCRIWYGGDGSYYVTSPYHPAKEAFLYKATVNYARSEMEIPISELVETAAFDDNKRRLKLSHHPDGFVQFSGEGIVSGKDKDGKIRGIGVVSWPLEMPVRGPAFGVTIVGIKRFVRAESIDENVCKFTHREVCLMPGPVKFSLEGYYFPHYSDAWCASLL